MNVMKKFLIALVVLNLWGCADSKEKLNVEKSAMVSATATVQAVDLKERTVTLKNQNGDTYTIKAGKEVVNLPQISVGDEVVAVYAEGLAVRMAQPGEVRAEQAQGVARAVPGSMPGGMEVIETTVTAKIERMDRANSTAVLRLPNDSLRVVKVQDPTNFDKVKVGDTIVITYTEALAVSVEKKI